VTDAAEYLRCGKDRIYDLIASASSLPHVTAVVSYIE
jgi:hypothetical protein